MQDHGNPPINFEVNDLRLNDGTESDSSFYFMRHIASPRNKVDIEQCETAEREISELEHKIFQLKTVDIPGTEQKMAE